MTNDLGGIVFVGKNVLCLKFSVGVEHTIRLETTKKLIEIIESRIETAWETNKLTIEPRYIDPQTGDVMTTITVNDGRNDIDRAVVFQTDLWEALMAVECLEVLPDCFRKFTPR